MLRVTLPGDVATGTDDLQGALARLRFLADAGATLASSLSLETTLRNIARLSVPFLADWCIVYLADDDGAIRRIAMEHAEGSGDAIAEEVQARFAIDPTARAGVPHVMRTGTSIFEPAATAAHLSVDVLDPAGLERTLAPLGITSWICVPLKARERTIGAISFVSTTPERPYDELDLALAEEVARVAALAVDNARIHGDVEEQRGRSDDALSMLDALLAGSPIGIAFLDTDLRYVRVNPALAKLKGSPQEIFIGKHPRDVVPALGPTIERNLSTVMASGAPLTGVRLEGDLPGGHRHLEATYYPVRSADGQMVGVGEVVMDRTRHQALEDERERVLALERRARAAAERSRDLLAALQRVTSVLARDLTVGEVARTVVDAAVHALGAGMGMLALIDGDELRIVGWKGYADELMERWRTFPLSAELPLSECVRDGRVLLIGSREERDLRYPALSDEKMRHPSAACLPLLSEGKAIGGVAVSFSSERAFDEEERLFMLALGETCGQALERAHLLEAERAARRAADESREQMEFLASASAVLGSSLDYEETLRQVAALVVPRLADWCAVHLVEPDGSIRAITVAHADPSKTEWIAEMQRRYPPDPDAPHGAAAVIRTGQPELYPQITDDLLERVARDPEHLQLLRSLGFRSGLAVPLEAEGRTLGAITLVAGATIDPYTEADLTFALALAARAGQAIQNARLFEETQRARADLGFSNALLRSQHEATVDGILVIGANGVVLSCNKRFTEMWGIPEEDLRTLPRELTFQRALDQLADPDPFRARRNHLEAHPLESARGEIELVDGRTFEHWTAPLLGDDGEVLGRAWYFRDISQHKEAERVLSDSKRRADFLAEASAILASSLDHRAFLRGLADAAVRWVADWCVIDVLERDGFVERLAIGSNEIAMQPVLSRLGAFRREPLGQGQDRGAHRVIQTGQWEFQPEILDEWLVEEARGEDAYLEFLRAQRLRSAICVPMIARGKTLGAITIVATGANRFGAADLAFARELGARAGAALDNARLFEDRAYIARTLQKSLLPHSLPHVEGLELAAAYHAAGEAFEVGGDFYDVFQLGRECVAVIGDVCGKGPDAAATTALTRHTLRASAVTARKPSKVLRALNDAMLRAESPFCTVALARIRATLDGARVWLACGGHPMPLVVNPNGEVGAIGAPGTILGCFDAPTLRDELVILARGDLLVLYTDGVTEARAPDGDPFGEERLHATLAGLAGRTAAEVATAVAETALEHQAGDARDDIAVLVVRVT